jgi:hypothetical protein
VLHYTRLQRLSSYKRSSLIGEFVSNEENEESRIQSLIPNSDFSVMHTFSIFKQISGIAGNTKGGSITVPLTSFLTGLD